MKTTLMLAAAALMAAACSSTDMYDGEKVETNQKMTYAENFARKYPNVNLNQSWDYSTKQTMFTIGSATRTYNNSPYRAATRGSEGGFTANGWYEVDNLTLAWMHEQLVEGRDNRKLGKPFYMTVPGTDFTIVPIYQGVASSMWNLHVVVDGVDYLVWQKINNERLGGTDDNPTNEHLTGTIQIKDEEDQEWHNLHGQWYDWGYGHWNSLYNTDGGEKWQADGSSNRVTAVRAVPYTFHNLPVGAEMYFYLEITEDGNDRDGNTITVHRNDVGAQQSSVKGMMLALEDCPLPANLAGNEAMIIGCEDADKGGSDWDMNDLVLLVYGQSVPKPVKIEQGDEVKEVKTVRYLIEDLGATDDFDFNDIVVDVQEIRSVTPTYTNGVVTAWTQTGYEQKAIIRHLGGTLPFRLTIGQTVLDEMGGEDTFKTSPDTEFTVAGWDINRHNISVEVKQEGSNGVYNSFRFPKAGEAPLILAVDPSQAWMQERQSVPASWFYIPD